MICENVLRGRIVRLVWVTLGATLYGTVPYLLASVSLSVRGHVEL